MQVGHQMGQVFPPKIFDGMWVVAFGRQVQQHNGIGASIGADRLHGLHTLMVEVAVAARDAVNQNAGRPDEANKLGQWLDSMARRSAPQRDPKRLWECCPNRWPGQT